MKRSWLRALPLIPFLFTCTPADSQSLGLPPLPVSIDTQYVSRLIPAISTPNTASLLGVVTSLLPKPVDMKLLVLATDGSEPGLAAIRTFLDTLGTPYDVVLLAAGQPLPALDNGSKGFYQGIILTIGNLGICDPSCRSALSLADWVRMDKYTKAYGVRTLSYYTYPEARYGLTPAGVVSTSDASPAFVSITSAGSAVFKDLRASASIKVANSYVYTAAAVAAQGETTSPILTLGGAVVGVTHKMSDGREYLALTMDNNPYLFHSAVFHYGLVRWLTKGIFLGAHKTYMTPQVDDIFLANDLFDGSKAACIPVGFAADPTFDPADQCPTLRISGWDLSNLASWQNNLRANPQFSQFRVSFAFNGFGATQAGGALPGDSLVAEATRQRSTFFWINHTYDHESLDCYKPVANSGICQPANSAQSDAEIQQNVSAGASLGLSMDSVSMVTPAISGLTNPAFLGAAAARGIRYLIADLSRPEGVPAAPNTGIWNSYQPSILMIPRRPTNIFYNTVSAATQVSGSETDEYNYFYGPNGIFRIGGPGGPPFFTSNQLWTDILNRESDNLLGYMTRGEIYPSMFHQSNLYSYNGSASLFTDVVGAALNKFASISTLPVISLKQSDLGAAMARRMQYNAAHVQGTITPGVSVEIRASQTATVPVTGVCSTGCETYGPDRQSSVSVPAGGAVTILTLLN